MMHHVHKLLFTLIAFFLLSPQIMGQKIGEWEVYPSYWQATKNVIAGKNVYALYNHNLLKYSTEDNSVQTYNSLAHLNGVSINYIGYSNATHTLVIIYSDGGIDLLSDNGELYYIPDLKDKVMANKEVVELVVLEDMAYLCTKFGYIELDLKEKVIRNTNNLEYHVRGITMDKERIYIGTTTGIYCCPDSVNKQKKENWKQLSKGNFTNLTYFDGILWGLNAQYIYKINAQSGVYQRMDTNKYNFLKLSGEYLIWGSNKSINLCADQNTIRTINYDNNWVDVSMHNNEVWASQQDEGLHGYKLDNETFVHKSGPIQPNSPKRDMANRIQWVGDRLLVAGGINDPLGTVFNEPIAMYYQEKEQEWIHLDGGFKDSIVKKYPNIRLSNTTSLVQDPFDENHHYMSLHRNGLVELKDGIYKNFYNSDNSILASILPNSSNYYFYVSCAGIQFDLEGNLWMLNSTTKDIIKVLKKDGKWVSLYYQDIEKASICDEFLFHSSGIKFLTSRRLGLRGFFGFDTRGTLEEQIDDRHILRQKIVNQDGTTYSPDEFYCMTEDLNGHIWCGTDRGVFVIEDATKYFDNDFHFEQIKIARNDGSGLADYLLNGVSISCIAVDGANRKWIGTHTNGLYLISEDGTEMIHHFSMDNSPIISNSIESIAVHPVTGKVMIGTDYGICSYISDATEAEEELEKDNIQVFPNPVKPDYNGPIVVKGLTMDAEVKILSTSGQLVWSGISNGGTFTWNGCTHNGKRVASGIYHIVANTADGKKAVVARIVIIR